MRWMCAVLALAFAARSFGAEEQRHARGRTLVSAAEPAIELTVASELRFEARVPFKLGSFEGERFVFVDADDKKALRRLVIVQFEHVTSGSSEIYRYDLTHGRERGGLRFITNSFAFPGARQSVASPKDEADHTNNALLAHGFTMPSVWLAARHVTIADGDRRRSEMIVFYMEGRPELTIADVYRGDEPTPMWRAEKPALEERAWASFTILPKQP